MLIVLQIPLFDARTFLTGESSKLSPPDWEKPSVGHHFLKHIGGLKRRLAGGSKSWLGEEYYCSASRWLRFRPEDSRDILIGGKTVGLATPLFRRWHSDGRCIIRVEIGWRIKLYTAIGGLPAPSIDAFFKSFLGQNVLIKTKDGLKETKLFDLASQALKSYLAASTSKKFAVDSLPKWQFSTGSMLVYVEALKSEIGELPGYAEAVALDDPPPAVPTPLEVSTFHCAPAGKEVTAWIVRQPRYSFENRAVLRDFRISILRMHAEVEGIERLRRWIDQERLSEANGISTEKVVAHSAAALEVFRPKLPTTQRGTGFKMAYSAYVQGSQGRMEKILDLLEAKVTKGLPLKDVLAAFTPPSLQTAHGPSPLFVVNNSGNIIYGDNSGQLAAATAGAGGIANASSPKIEQSPAYQAALASLTQAISTLSEKLTDEKTKARLAVKLEDLQAPDQDRKWYEVSAKGLKEAAEKVGEVAIPVVKAAAGLLAAITGGA